VGAKPHIDDAQRRVRLGRRHHLAASTRAATPLDAVRGMVALHGTDPATVYLSLFARLQHASVADVERALYDDRVLLRMLGMRRTMFVVSVDFAPVVQAACTRAIAIQERRRTLQLFGQAGMDGDIDAWMKSVEEDTVAALDRRGEATAQELARDLPELRRQVTLAEGKSYAAVQGVSTRILMQLSADGRIVRGRPRGSWISSQYRWSPLDAWLPGGMPECSTPSAQADLVGAWLRTFGPGTLTDLKWWSGLTMGEVKRALSTLNVVEVDLDGGTGWVHADDLQTDATCEPWVSLLPALDPTPMGFAERAWFLGGYAPTLFDRSGNIGPSVWCDGRIVGGWAQRKNGAIAYKLLEDVGSEAERAIESAAHGLGRLLDVVRVTPRFRTPLERELSA
jgi:winged helix DNA-binding protein